MINVQMVSLYQFSNEVIIIQQQANSIRELSTNLFFHFLINSEIFALNLHLSTTLGKRLPSLNLNINHMMHVLL